MYSQLITVSRAPCAGRKACLLLLIILLLLAACVQSEPKVHQRRPRPNCGGRCSQSCEKLCGTPQFHRCCAGLMKRSVDHGEDLRDMDQKRKPIVAPDGKTEGTGWS